mgnify:CR=1 FL=1
MPTVSLVGYTSAGKSTLFNLLAEERRYTSSHLFSTLDPLLRRVSFTDGAFFFLSRGLTNDLGAGRAIRWEHLLHGARGEVHAGFGHDRMHHLRCSLELGTTGSVIAKAGALTFTKVIQNGFPISSFVSPPAGFTGPGAVPAVGVGTALQATVGSHSRRSLEIEHGGSRANGLDWYFTTNLHRDKGWRDATLEAWTSKVPWYRTSRSLTDEWNAKYPNHPVSYDTGGFLNNVLFKYPGWRAREGFGHLGRFTWIAAGGQEQQRLGANRDDLRAEAGELPA